MVRLVRSSETIPLHLFELKLDRFFNICDIFVVSGRYTLAGKEQEVADKNSQDISEVTVCPIESAKSFFFS